jgi:toxin FitB
MLIDSDIVIYATEPEYGNLRQLIANSQPAVSAISYVEVLGYHQITEADKTLLHALFQIMEVLPIDDAVVEQAIQLRQQRRMSLGDAIVAGTAIVHQLTLATHNTQDFAWIPDLSLTDPLLG